VAQARVAPKPGARSGRGGAAQAFGTTGRRRRRCPESFRARDLRLPTEPSRSLSAQRTTPVGRNLDRRGDQGPRCRTANSPMARARGGRSRPPYAPERGAHGARGELLRRVARALSFNMIASEARPGMRLRLIYLNTPKRPGRLFLQLPHCRVGSRVSSLNIGAPSVVPKGVLQIFFTERLFWRGNQPV
jgi:hypothetical protein